MAYIKSLFWGSGAATATVETATVSDLLDNVAPGDDGRLQTVYDLIFSDKGNKLIADALRVLKMIQDPNLAIQCGMDLFGRCQEAQDYPHCCEIACLLLNKLSPHYEIDSRYMAIIDLATQCLPHEGGGAVLAGLLALDTLNQLYCRGEEEDLVRIKALMVGAHNLPVNRDITLCPFIEPLVVDVLNAYHLDLFSLAFGGLKLISSAGMRITLARNLLEKCTDPGQIYSLLEMLCAEMRYETLLTEAQQTILDVVCDRLDGLEDTEKETLFGLLFCGQLFNCELDGAMARLFEVFDAEDTLPETMGKQEDEQIKTLSVVDTVLAEIKDGVQKKAAFEALYTVCAEELKGEMVLYGLREEWLEAMTPEQAEIAVEWALVNDGAEWLEQVKVALAAVEDLTTRLVYTVKLDASRLQDDLLTASFGEKHTPASAEIWALMDVIRQDGRFALFDAFFNVLNISELEEDVKWELEFLGLELCDDAARGRDLFVAGQIIRHLLDNETIDRRQERIASALKLEAPLEAELLKDVVLLDMTDELREALFTSECYAETLFEAIKLIGELETEKNILADWIQNIKSTQLKADIATYMAKLVRTGGDT